MANTSDYNLATRTIQPKAEFPCLAMKALLTCLVAYPNATEVMHLDVNLMEESSKKEKQMKAPWQRLHQSKDEFFSILVEKGAY